MHGWRDHSVGACVAALAGAATLLCGCPGSTAGTACGASPQTLVGSQTATLDERYDSSVTDVLFVSNLAEGNSTCGALDGLGVGVALPLVVTDQSQNVGCFVKSATVTLPTSVQVIHPVSDRMLAVRYDDTFALFRAQVSIGACTGVLEIGFKTPSSRPLDPKVAGQYPPFLVERLFSPNRASNCPSLAAAPANICADTWVGTLSAN